MEQQSAVDALTAALQQLAAQQANNEVVDGGTKQTSDGAVAAQKVVEQEYFIISVNLIAESNPYKIATTREGMQHFCDRIEQFPGKFIFNGMKHSVPTNDFEITHTGGRKEVVPAPYSNNILVLDNSRILAVDIKQGKPFNRK